MLENAQTDEYTVLRGKWIGHAILDLPTMK